MLQLYMHRTVQLTQTQVTQNSGELKQGFKQKTSLILILYWITQDADNITFSIKILDTNSK